MEEDSRGCHGQGMALPASATLLGSVSSHYLLLKGNSLSVKCFASICSACCALTQPFSAFLVTVFPEQVEDRGTQEAFQGQESWGGAGHSAARFFKGRRLALGGAQLLLTSQLCF